MRWCSTPPTYRSSRWWTRVLEILSSRRSSHMTEADLPQGGGGRQAQRRQIDAGQPAGRPQGFDNRARRRADPGPFERGGGVAGDRVHAERHRRARSRRPSGPTPTATITGKVAAAALGAVESADLVLFVVDGQAGVTSDDLALVGRLRKVKAPVMVVANKVDNRARRAGRWRSFGASDWASRPRSPPSTAGERGDLLDRIVELLPDRPGARSRRRRSPASASSAGPTSASRACSTG